MRILEHPVFPKPVLTFKAEEDFSKELQYIKRISYARNGDNRQGTTSDNKYLLYEPELKRLKKFFQTSLNFYMKEMFKSKQILSISQSWATIINQGQGFDAHDHPNSLVNGCFYFEKPPQSSPLQLINGRKSFLYVDTFEETKYNTDTYWVVPEEMELVLFPNNLHHRVPISTAIEERRSLAFNTFITDVIGSEFQMTQIDIDRIRKNH